MVLLCQKDQNAYYIKQRRHFISLEERLHKSEYENVLHHFQNIARNDNDWKGARKNLNAKKFKTVSGMALSYGVRWTSRNIFFTEDEAPRWASNHGHMHVKSLLSNGYNAGYVKDMFECNKRPCECAGFEIKDKTIIGTDCCNVFDRLPKGLSKNGLKNRPIQIGSRSPLRGLRVVTCRVYLVV